MNTEKSERRGVFFIILNTMLWGIFPVLINRGSHTIPPLTFAAFTALIGAVGAFLYSLYKKTTQEIYRRNTYFPLLMIILFISLIPSILLFVGTSKTTALNTSLLGLSEIIFTLIFTHFYGETTTATKLIGAFGILIGAGFILFHGSWHLNSGDVLIIVSTAFYPIGNLYSKRLVKIISPETILMVRWGVSGLILLGLAAIFENFSQWPNIIVANWKLLIVNGLFLYFLSKLFWYQSLKQLDITKAISLNMTYPIFSILLLLALGEKISLLQGVGIIIMALGVIFSLRRKSTNPYTYELHST